jgi:hypothetical protein
LLFALNMAVYTGGGDVYSAAQIRAWLEAAGIEGVEERRLDIAPDAFAIVGRRASVQSEVAIESEMKAIASRLSRVGKIAWRELEAAGKLREDARPRHLVFPNEFGRTLAKALVTAREEGRADQEAAMEAHYLETLPRLRVAQIVGSDEPAATFMHAELDWAQLPRMSAAIDRLFDVLGDADVDAARVMGTATANAFRAGARTFGELFMQTHYGACMPLLYGYPGDLAYFAGASGARACSPRWIGIWSRRSCTSSVTSGANEARCRRIWTNALAVGWACTSGPSLRYRMASATTRFRMRHCSRKSGRPLRVRLM